ncbi:hypothetical protein FS837_011262 [Tulasnella sp. UAMH 9824]|nr:hypothetical protein FS837_011262 [Tulasnella sp. UAMH 9824]
MPFTSVTINVFTTRRACTSQSDRRKPGTNKWVLAKLLNELRFALTHPRSGKSETGMRLVKDWYLLHTHPDDPEARLPSSTSRTLFAFRKGLLHLLVSSSSSLNADAAFLHQSDEPRPPPPTQPHLDSPLHHVALLQPRPQCTIFSEPPNGLKIRIWTEP